jgi:hypothetical protein
VFSYPPEDQLQEGVRDVQLADLGADGEPELIVGFWGLAGAHAVSPLGETIWRNRTAPSIFSLAVTPPNELTDWRKLLVTGHERGILELNHFGRHVPPYTVADRRLQSLHPARYEGGDATYCGIADNGDGTLVAVGLAEGTQQQLVEIWNYRLPAMVSPQVEAVTSGQLLDGSRSVGPASVGPMPNVPAPDVQAPDSESRQKQGGQWLFAGSDGSLHAIGHDAGFFDYWRLGKPISGVAIVRINDQPAVIVSSDKEVTAWRVEPLAAKPQP